MRKTQNKKSISALLITSLLSMVASSVFYISDFHKIEQAQALYGEGGNLNGLPIAPSDTSSSQIQTDTDYDGNIFAAYRKNLGGGCYGIYYRRYSSAGTSIDSENVVENSCSPAKNRSNPDIAVDTYGNFFIVWLDNTDSELYLKAYNSNQTPISPSTTTITTSASTGIPSVAATKSRSYTNLGALKLIITWAADDGATGYNVYMNSYSYDYSAGSPVIGSLTDLSNNVMIHSNNSGNDYDQNFSDVSIGANYAFITWAGAEDVSASPTILNSIWLRIINLNTGTPEGNIYQISNSSNAVTNPSIAASSRDSTDSSPAEIKDELFMAWQGQGSGDTDGVYMKKINCAIYTGNINCDPTNSVNTANMEIRVNTTTTGLQQKPQVSIYNNNIDTTKTSSNEDTSIEYVNVTWITPDQNSSNKIIAGQNFKNNLNRKGTNYTTNISITDTDSLETGMDQDGDYVVAFHNATTNQVNLQKYHSVLYSKNSQESITPPDITNAQESPDIAIGPNGNYVIAFTDFTGSSGPNIVYALYDKFGNPIKALGIANSYTTGIQSNPSVDFYKNSDPLSSDYGKFIISWAGAGPGGDSNGVFFREFNADGTPIATESIAHTAGADDETLPHVSAGQYKQFIIGFLRDTGSVTEARYYYRNNISGNEGQLNSTTGTTISNIKVQISPAANNASESDSKFAAIWRSDSQLRKREGYISSGSISFNGNDSAITSNATTADISGANLTGYGFYYVIGYAYNGAIRNYSYAHGGSTYDNNQLIRENIGIASDPQSDEVLGTIRVSTDQLTGNTLFAYERQYTPEYHLINPAPTNSMVEIEAKFYKFNSGNLTQFGPPFTPSNALTSSSIATIGDIYFNSSSDEDSEKMAGFTYIIDDENIYVTTIEDPFNLGTSPLLQPVASQEITTGGKLITVPNNLNFGDVSKSTSDIINISTDATPAYVELSDLDGTPFSLTLNMTNLQHSTMPAETINKSYFEVKNNDGSNTGGSNPGVTAQNAYTNVNDITLDPSTNSYASLSSDRTLATKTGSSTGIWRIYPSFKLTIPALAENGIYNGTLTFTLI